jgi:outer membrane protein TolC
VIPKKAGTSWRVVFTVLLLALCFCFWPHHKAEAEPPYIGGGGREKAGGPVEVSIEEAILMALENNRALRVERLNPDIRRTFEEEEQSVFDPVLSGSGSFSREKGLQRSRVSTGLVENTDTLAEASVGASQLFPTGTEVGVGFSAERTWSDLYSDLYASRVGLSVTQALLRGAGTRVNLATLEQARLDTDASEYEFRGFAEALVAQVEETYWDYALAQRQIQIVEQSLEIAEQQLREMEEMIAVGRLAESEVVAAQAEIALQRQALIAARSALKTTRLRLLRLLNPAGSDLWERDIVLRELPTIPDSAMDPVQAHVDVAMRFRPDLNAARLGVLRNDLEVVKTKNGLLPKLDLFVILGKTGYADSFGSSVSNITEDAYDFSAGLVVRYPFRNREAEARHRRSRLRLDQALEGVANFAQLVELDVRTAYIDIDRAKEQIAASRATLKLQEEKLRIETEKLRVGRSTAFLVSQAQRDRLSSQIAEVQAVANYFKALVALYRLEGSLLERRGISAPGREPVELESRSDDS